MRVIINLLLASSAELVRTLLSKEAKVRGYISGYIVIRFVFS
jgi:hypothetical protein